MEQKKEYIQQEITENEMQAVTGGKEITTGDIVIGSIAGTGAVATVGALAYTLHKGNRALQQGGRVAEKVGAVLPK